MIDELLLLCGNDIPFEPAQLVIHQPRLKEIGYITEDKFWIGCELLKFDKEKLSDKDKLGLLNQSNFNIIMSMIREKNLESQKAKINVLSILTLLFPDKRIVLGKQAIQLYNLNDSQEVHEINNDNFQAFKGILIEMFCFKNLEDEQYNPSGQLAERIRDKIMKGREKRAQLAPVDPTKKIAIFSRYMSILAVGQKKNLNDLKDYTVYQLMDEFKRFNLKLHYDAWVKYKIAGAQNLEDPEDWLKDIHSPENKYQKNDDWSQFIQ